MSRVGDRLKYRTNGLSSLRLGLGFENWVDPNFDCRILFLILVLKVGLEWVNLPGPSTWSVYLVRLPGPSTWSVYLVCLPGPSTWSV